MNSRGRRDADEDHFDMLPFIAILLCTLGALLFVTLAMASLNFGSSDDAWDFRSDVTGGRPLPLLIEWNGHTAAAHLETGIVEFQCFGSQSEPRAAESEIDRLINTMQQRGSSRYALFAVRPSGFETFQSLAQRFRARSLEIGFEPVAQDKKITLLLPPAGAIALPGTSEKHL